MENRLELTKADTGVWFCVGWVNGKRVRKSTRTKDRLEAEEQRLKWLKDGDAGIVPAKAGYTVQDIADLYKKKPRPLPFSYDTLRMLYYWEQGMGHVKLQALDSAAIHTWADRRFESIHTKARVLVVVRAAVRYAVKKGMLPSAPFVAVENVDSKRLRFLERDELKRLIEACKNHSEALWALVLFMVTTGGRRGEIITLRWKDIDLERRQVTFTWTKGASGKEKKRTVPLNESAMEAVKSQLKKRVVGDPMDYVFKRQGGKPWHKRKASKQASKIPGWRVALKEAGITDFRPHDLRHTFASMLRRERKMPLDRIAELLGHSKLELTQIYAHLIVEDHKEDLDALRL